MHSFLPFFSHLASCPCFTKWSVVQLSSSCSLLFAGLTVPTDWPWLCIIDAAKVRLGEVKSGANKPCINILCTFILWDSSPLLFLSIDPICRDQNLLNYYPFFLSFPISPRVCVHFKIPSCDASDDSTWKRLAHIHRKGCSFSLISSCSFFPSPSAADWWSWCM